MKRELCPFKVRYLTYFQTFPRASMPGVQKPTKFPDILNSHRHEHRLKPAHTRAALDVATRTYITARSGDGHWRVACDTHQGFSLQRQSYSDFITRKRHAVRDGVSSPACTPRQRLLELKTNR